MRVAAHFATLAALIALGLGLGRWLRDPNPGGLVFLLLLSALVAVAVRHLYGAPEPAAASAVEPEPVAPDPDSEPLLWDHRIDLNRASLEELQRLPGVGPVAARRILDEREAGGPFATVEELVRVPGFGPAKVRVLAPDARVSHGGLADSKGGLVRGRPGARGTPRTSEPTGPAARRESAVPPGRNPKSRPPDQ